MRSAATTMTSSPQSIGTTVCLTKATLSRTRKQKTLLQLKRFSATTGSFSQVHLSRIMCLSYGHCSISSCLASLAQKKSSTTGLPSRSLRVAMRNHHQKSKKLEHSPSNLCTSKYYHFFCEG